MRQAATLAPLECEFAALPGVANFLRVPECMRPVQPHRAVRYTRYEVAILSSAAERLSDENIGCSLRCSACPNFRFGMLAVGQDQDRFSIEEEGRLQRLSGP